MKNCVFVLIVVLLNSCSNWEEEIYGNTKLVGKWIRVNLESEDAKNKLLNDGIQDYNPIFDNYQEAVILEFTKDYMTFHDYFQHVISNYIQHEEYDVIDNNIITLYSIYDYKLDGSKLVLIEELYFIDRYIGKQTTTYRKYKGDLPPKSWVKDILIDSYEADNSFQTATKLSINGKWQSHSAINDDEDWFSFDAELNKNYLIRVNNLTGNQIIRLYDTNGTTLLAEDKNDDQNYFSNDSYANAALVWKCPKSGNYFFKVKNNSAQSMNYYAVSINETTLNP